MELFPADENADFYSIGAAIALSVAILGAISNILTAKVRYLWIVSVKLNHATILKKFYFNFNINHKLLSLFQNGNSWEMKLQQQQNFSTLVCLVL